MVAPLLPDLTFLLAVEMLHNVPRVYILGTVAAVILGFVGTMYYLYFVDSYHFLTVKEGVLYRDGVRSIREFNTAITRSRAKTVVMLIDDQEYLKEPFRSEVDYLAHTKIRPVGLPIKLGGYPTTEQVQSFLRDAENPKRHPILIHCAQGIRRTGMMVAAYQMSVMGWDKEKAKAEIKAFGHSDRTINDIKRFIDVYDPVKREVTKDLGVGTE